MCLLLTVEYVEKRPNIFCAIQVKPRLSGRHPVVLTHKEHFTQQLNVCSSLVGNDQLSGLLR